MIEILFFAPAGCSPRTPAGATSSSSYTRQEFRRSTHADIGALTYPARAVESYAEELVGLVDREVVARRGFRCVIDYGYTASSSVVPAIMGALGVEVIGLNAGVRRRAAPRRTAHARQAERLVTAAGADLGAVFSADRRAPVADRRAGPAGARPTRRCSCSCTLAVRRGPAGPDRGADHGVASRSSAIVEGSGISHRAHRGQARRARPGGRRAGRAVRRGRRAAASSSPASCRPTTRWSRSAGARAVGARRRAAVGAASPQLPPSTLVHADVHCPGRSRAPRCACSSRRPRASRPRASTASRCARTAAGWSSCPTPTARCSTSTPRGRRRRTREELVDRYRARARADRRRARGG